MPDPLAYHAGLWASQTLGRPNPQFQNEWYDLLARHQRLCIVAPREHGKSEVFSVNSVAHHAVFNPGSSQYVFSATMDQSKQLLERIVGVVSRVKPQLVSAMAKSDATDVIFANWSRVTVTGAGKSVRGAHPDRIIGDDVLTMSNSRTKYQRRKLEDWWLGTVAPMAHVGVRRPLAWGRSVTVEQRKHAPTQIVLTGTPFHQQDLLLSMRESHVYHFRRYSAVFDEGELVDGTWAVEVS